MLRRKPTQRISRAFERIERMRTDRLRLPFAHFVMLMPFMTKDTIDQLVLIRPPQKIGKIEIPKDLQMVTFGKLVSLQNAPQSNDYLKTCCALVAELTDIPAERVGSYAAQDVLGIVNMVKSEMQRIGDLFKSLQSDSTSEELMAGIDRLNFGAFGVVDWYAKRMGMTNHDEVFETPWARIYQAMKIDHEQGEFERRYRKIMERRNK